jgi:hypothetical protein
MKVKIVQCYNSLSWYTRRIGEIFEVYYGTQGAERYFLVEDKEKTSQRFMEKSDCEIVADEKPKVEKVKKYKYVCKECTEHCKVKGSKPFCPTKCLITGLDVKWKLKKEKRK